MKIIYPNIIIAVYSVIVFLCYLPFSESKNIEDLPLTNTSETEDYDYEPYVPYIFTDDCKFESCVRKCCETGYYIPDYGDGDCTLIKDAPVHVEEWEVPDDWPKSLEVFVGIPDTDKEHYYCTSFEFDEYELKKNGDVVYSNETYSFNDNCIGNTINDKNETEAFSIICVTRIRKTQLEEIGKTVKKVGSYVSIACFFVVFILYYISPSKTSLQSQCIICFCIALIPAHVVILLLAAENPYEQYGYAACVSLAFIKQYFGLSFNCWLTATIFDIFRIIRGTTKLQSLSNLQKRNRQFLIYSLLAWGFPLLVLTATLIMQFLPKDLGLSESAESHLIRPDIGSSKCWVTNEKGANYVYFFGIEAVLMIIDIFFIIYTVVLLKKDIFVTGICKIGNCGEQKPKLTNHNKINYVGMFWQQFCILNLFVLSWVTNCITLIYPTWQFWKIVDMINSFQGLFVLLIVAQSRKFVLLSRAYDKLKSVTETVSTSLSIPGRKRSWDVSSTSMNVLEKMELPKENSKI